MARPELLEEARRRASIIVRGAAAAGRYRMYAAAPGIPENPSLFHGLAGIGYQLLRLARPETVPSVLTLEPPRKQAKAR